MSAVPRTNRLKFGNRPYSKPADVETPPGGAEGALLALGGRFGGFSFFAQRNRLNYVYNWFGLERYTVTSTEALPSGPVKLRVDFTVAVPGGNTATLFINDKRVGEGKI